MTDTAAHPTDVAPPRPFADTDDDRTKAMEANMIARGESTTESLPIDYFGFEQEHKVVLPDGVQFFVHKELNEGDRRKYMKEANRDVKLQKATGDAYLRMMPGEDRVALLKAAIVDWNLIQKGKPFQYSKGNVDTVLAVFPPKIIDLVHKDILKHNDWLLGEVTIEDIDRELQSLQEQRQAMVEAEAGKGSS